jgi:hypothetical protein
MLLKLSQKIEREGKVSKSLVVRMQVKTESLYTYV